VINHELSIQQPRRLDHQGQHEMPTVTIGSRAASIKRPLLSVDVSMCLSVWRRSIWRNPTPSENCQ